jgi:hypothetical protein
MSLTDHHPAELEFRNILGDVRQHTSFYPTILISFYLAYLLYLKWYIYLREDKCIAVRIHYD